MLRWFRSRDWPAVLGVIRIDDDLIERLRRRVHARLGVLKIDGRTRDKAEAEIVEAVRWEIVSVFREDNPGREYQLKPSWPLAWAILADDGQVMVRFWIGQDYADGGNGISPVRTTVRWTLKAAQPARQAQAVPAAPKPASALERLNSRKGKT